jgi:hypothetical protein
MILSGEAYPVPSVLLGAASGVTVAGWWEADVGITGPAGTVTSAGTSPPTLTVNNTGTRALRWAGEVYTVSGGTVTMRSSYDGGHTWPEWLTFSTGGGTISLPVTAGLTSLGYQLSFPSGSYNNSQTYRFDSSASSWAPIVGSTAMGLYSGSLYPTWSAATSTFNNQPTTTANCRTGSHCYKTGARSDSPPYWFAIVTSIDSATGGYAYLGRQGASGAGLAFFVESSTTVRVTDATVNLTSNTVSPTTPTCYVMDYEGAASTSTLYVNGVANATASMTGNATNQGYFLGYDQPYGYTGNPTIALFAYGTGQITADMARGICARSAFKYGTGDVGTFPLVLVALDMLTRALRRRRQPANDNALASPTLDQAA